MSNHLYRKDKPKKTVYDDIRMFDNIYDENCGSRIKEHFKDKNKL